MALYCESRFVRKRCVSSRSLALCEVDYARATEISELSFRNTLRPRKCRKTDVGSHCVSLYSIRLWLCFSTDLLLFVGRRTCVSSGDIWATPEGEPLVFNSILVLHEILCTAKCGETVGNSEAGFASNNYEPYPHSILPPADYVIRGIPRKSPK